MITPAIINVAYKRMFFNNPNRDIQLSEYFMKKFSEEVKEYSNLNFAYSKEIKYVVSGKTFKVFERAYRDDSNDKDVEEAIYDLLAKI
jgi:hypothetical protein